MSLCAPVSFMAIGNDRSNELGTQPCPRRKDGTRRAALRVLDVAVNPAVDFLARASPNGLSAHMLGWTLTGVAMSVPIASSTGAVAAEVMWAAPALMWTAVLGLRLVWESVGDTYFNRDGSSRGKSARAPADSATVALHRD